MINILINNEINLIVALCDKKHASIDSMILGVTDTLVVTTMEWDKIFLLLFFLTLRIKS